MFFAVRCLLAFVLLGLSLRFVPPLDGHVLNSRPPSRASVLGAAFGRREAGADVVWVRLVQLLGDPRYSKARYPALEEWLELIADLHPRLMGPFYFGVTLLLGDPERRERVDELLAVAEQRVPDEFRFPLERGVLAYFGRFEPIVAAEHLERAAAKAGAPPFIGQLASTLRKRGIACSSIAHDAELVSQGASSIGDRTVECIKRRIEAAAAAARLNDDPDTSVEVLVQRGHLPAEVLIPGVCWTLREGTATPGPCGREKR
jgi:hypothetical protein